MTRNSALICRLAFRCSFDQIFLVGTFAVFGLETKVISVSLSCYDEACNYGLVSNTMIDDDDDEMHRKYDISMKCHPYLYLAVSFLVFC